VVIRGLGGGPAPLPLRPARPTRVNEGGRAVFAIQREGPAIADGAEITINWQYAPAGAEALDRPVAADFLGGAAPAGGALTFRGRQTRAAFSVTTADDNLNERDETFQLTLSAGAETVASAGGVAVDGARRMWPSPTTTRWW